MSQFTKLKLVWIIPQSQKGICGQRHQIQIILDPKPGRQISHHSNMSNLKDGEDDQARTKPIYPFKIFKLKGSLSGI